MDRWTTTAALAGAILMAAAGSAQALRFDGLKYNGGGVGFGKRTGSLVVENGELRFEDRKGRPFFRRPVASARAWVGAEKRRSGRCVALNLALIPVLVPLAGAGGGLPTTGDDCLRGHRIVMVRVGEGPEARVFPVRAPEAQVTAIVEAIELAAERARTAPPQEQPPSTPSSSSTSDPTSSSREQSR
jgi:hypothetical protein